MVTKKLNTETYKGYEIKFRQINTKEHFYVMYELWKDKTFIRDGDAPTKQEALDWVKDFIDNEFDGDWKTKAKVELEKKLGVKTKITNYEYYTDKGALSLESTSGSGSNGESEWIVFENEEDARRLAVDKVREDLENEPSLFSQSFLENHIDMERLDYQLEQDADESSRSYWDDIASESDTTYGNRQIQELVDGGFLSEIDEMEVNDDERDVEDMYKSLDDYDDALENAINSMSKDKMSQGGIEYLKEMYSDSEAIEKAMELGGINYDEASEDAVDEDGVAHFLDGYDGQEVELPSGAVAYGTN
jgi:hypothetical protein